MTDTNQTPPIDSASKRDILLSLLIPLYGAIGGAVSLLNGKPRRGRVMRRLSTVNILVTMGILHWLS